MFSWSDFKEIWVVDFEFYGGAGNPPIPVCYCAYEIYSKKSIKHWLLDSKNLNPQYSTKDNAVFIAYFASAEMGCHIALNWDHPRYIVDLFAEFRNNTNGKDIPSGRNLLGACINYGVGGGDATLKDSMRDRILQGPPFIESEKNQILDYCMKDVDLTKNLFLAMRSSIDIQRALLRGRYMWAVAKMEFNGIPIDTEALDNLKKYWELIKIKLIEKVDAIYGVYEGTTFKLNKFEEFLIKNKIPWEFTSKGHPKTDENFMKDQSKAYPLLKPLQELRFSLSQLKLNDLEIGKDGRNRTLLSPFGAKTGRNLPSSSKFIFGNAVWLRHLIKPFKGHALAYIDYDQQEIGIAAALSNDKNLSQAYSSGDPYINFAIQSGVVPPGATKDSHSDMRELFKTCMLGINYGMHDITFAKRANLSVAKARELYSMHHAVFRTYWNWIQDYMDTGQIAGCVYTKYGWKYHTIGLFKPDKKLNSEEEKKKYKDSLRNTLQNFPMQGNGADILRVAICLCLENGIKVIAPVHDAILIESTIDDIEKDAAKASKIMTIASQHVIKFPLTTDVKIIKYPDRYTDKRGSLMWNSIGEIINVQK